MDPQTSKSGDDIPGSRRSFAARTRRYRPFAAAEDLAEMGLHDPEEIGRGGFGVVYRCVQRALDRVVAVKVLSTEIDDDARERFVREEQAMGRLSGHPNIVDILQVGVTPGGLPFIVMPYAVHGSLERLVRENGPLDWADSVRVGVRLAGAIESAHRVQVLHRDVKPANVLLSRYGEPQLTDFGIARIPGGFRTSAELITGSPAFTAPEILAGEEPTERSDVYGLGSTLFALITGHAAYERQSGERVIAQFLRIASDPLPDLRRLDIPADVADIVEQAMAHDPARRPPSAFELGELLRSVQRRHGQVPDEMALLAPESATVTENTAEDAATHRYSVRDAGALVTGPRRPAPLQPPAADRTPSVPPTSPGTFVSDTTTRAPMPRPELLEALRAAGDRRLTVVHGPAGFGKSTVAAQWAAELAGRGADVAWLGIERDDDQEVWFLAHLVAAIRQVCPDVGAGLEQMLEERASEAVPYAIAALVEETSAGDRPVIVVIDDWHRVTDLGAHRVLAALLDNGSPRLRFVVVTRERSGLPASRLRVRDELTEIGPDLLRFALPETARMLREHNGFALSDDQIQRIQDTTGGWPAAIRPVGLSLRDGTLPDDLPGEAIHEYLAEHLLDGLEPHMLDFLAAVAVAERVCGSLATALSGEPDAERLLEEAERRELFVGRIERAPGWFRVQPLWAEQLRERLERDQPEQLKSLHRKAARWYADHRQLRRSVDHALAASDSALALDLLEQHGMDLIERSQLATLLGSVAKLPMHQVASRTELLLVLARANIGLQQSGTARTALGRLSTLLGPPAGAADTLRWRSQTSVLTAADEIARDRTAGVLERVSDCLAHADDLPAWTVSAAANVASYVRRCEFDFDGARRLQEWAEPYHARSKAPLGQVFGLLIAGTAAYEQLEIDTATACFEQACEIARERSGPRSQAMWIAAALLGESFYRRGDLDTAERLLDCGDEPVARVGPVDFAITAFVIGARVQAVRGDTAAAAARLDEGLRTAAERRLPRLAAHLRAERLRLGIGGDALTDSAILQSGMRPWRHATGAAVLLAEAEEIATIRALLARHYRGLETSGAAAPLGTDDTAVKRARALHGRIGEHRRPRAELDSGLLLAECLAAAGWTGEAIAVLTPAVRRCADLGWTRPLLDAGPGVLSLLPTLRSQVLFGAEDGDDPEIVHRFLDEVF
ncbi:serine/threonine-protein kinase [Nocardia aurantia]|uniref:non-specific serine/threonine protein kinase n=1 Tax=Nocardia aurantia TaxID=2585199 RepID=A0A7K0E129_9NOCA|nr:serine/threonine-protein kinase [Nocardia aurantia]MQY31487.1 Serine/threonine-protein kinase PknK [Nocardia aurantia]